MVRAFTDEPVDPAVVDDLIDLARRAPSAGNSQGMAYLVLEGADDRPLLGRLAARAERRASFGWPGLVDAPVLVVVLVRPSAWVERYAEPDKAAAGLGDVRGRLAGALLVGRRRHGVGAPPARARSTPGLGACFFGLFGHEDDVLAGLGVPEGWRAVGTVALGHPAPDPPGLSASRARPPLDEVLHRGGW